ncbi:MAG TPA: hypothetical protein VNU71_14330, partial [Burkholderiaceae bacterium]|nr:hypothetical protein [Burkholderiaceae bacterium]
MQSLIRFIVLIEARRMGAPLGIALAALLACALALAGGAAQAQSAGASAKVAADLRASLAATSRAQPRWARELGGVRHVKALIVANSPDPELTELRAQVLAVGGSVYYRYLSVSALSVLLPANRVDEIARRADVQSISPNRPTTRSASALELATGAADARAAGAMPGVDGSGVGIAVLDSGVAWSHANFRGGAGQPSRVLRAVDLQRAGDAAGRRWNAGVDMSALLYVGADRGGATAAFERLIAADRNVRADGYGHGSHVAG